MADDKAFVAPVRWLIILAAGLAAWYVAVYIVLVVGRLNFPYPLESNEGMALDHLFRVMRGHKLYVEPSFDFAAVLYPPLYYYVAAPVAAIVGIDFLPLRLVSFISSLGVFALIGAFVYRETRHALPSWLAMGLFASTYVVVGRWFDLARVDMLLAALILGSAYCLLHCASRQGQILAGVLIVAAALTKQTAAATLAPMILVFIWQHRQRALPLILTGAATLLVSLAVIQAVHAEGGWMYYYLIAGPGQHPIRLGRIFGFLGKEYNRELLIAYGLALTFLLLGARRLGGGRRSLYLAMMVGAFFVGLAGNMKIGAIVNHYIPFFATTAICFGLAIDFLRGDAGPAGRWSRHRREAVIFALCVAQFLLMAYDPREVRREALAYQPGPELLETMTAPGNVLVFNAFSYLRHFDGRRPYVHPICYNDLVGWTGDAPSRKLGEEANARIAAGEFDTIILDAGDSPREEWTAFAERYEFVATAEPTVNPLNGYRANGGEVYRRK